MLGSEDANGSLPMLKPIIAGGELLGSEDAAAEFAYSNCIIAGGELLGSEDADGCSLVSVQL